jgi:hypothetical protein
LLRGHWSDQEELTILLRDWERWSAEVLESHLSYPVLSYYRSQPTTSHGSPLCASSWTRAHS